MTNQRIARTNQQQKSEMRKASGILQRAAVRSDSGAGVRETEDQEVIPNRYSAKSKNLSQVPISTKKQQEFQETKSQSHPKPPMQTKMKIGESGERIQGKSEMTGKGQFSSEVTPCNDTGLPDRLKTGIENLSGYSMDDVKVYYNSDKPEQLQAKAYAQNKEIHIAAGQEKYLPHEAWHVVQQKQGRVKPTRKANGKAINTEAALEQEADVMGERATTALTKRELKHSVGKTEQKGEVSIKQPIQMQNEEEDEAKKLLGVKANDEKITDGVKAAVKMVAELYKKMEVLKNFEKVRPLYKDLWKSLKGREQKNNNDFTLTQNTLTKEMAQNEETVSVILPTLLIRITDGILTWISDPETLNSYEPKGDEEINKYIEFLSNKFDDLDKFITSVTQLLGMKEEKPMTGTVAYIDAQQALNRVAAKCNFFITSEHGKKFTAQGRARPIETIVDPAVSEVSNLLSRGYKKDSQSILNAYSTLLERGSKTGNAPMIVIGDTSDVYKKTEDDKVLNVLYIMGKKQSVDSLDSGVKTRELEDMDKLPEPPTEQKVKFIGLPEPKLRGAGQNANMEGTNARGYACLMNLDGWDRDYWEWLHIRGAALGGATDSENLVVGTKDANTQMMPFENMVREIGRKVQNEEELKEMDVTWELSERSDPHQGKHAYKRLMMHWVVEANKDASKETVEWARQMSGLATFRLLDQGVGVSKEEVKRMEKKLNNLRITPNVEGQNPPYSDKTAAQSQL